MMSFRIDELRHCCWFLAGPASEVSLLRNMTYYIVLIRFGDPLLALCLLRHMDIDTSTKFD